MFQVWVNYNFQKQSAKNPQQYKQPLPGRDEE